MQVAYAIWSKKWVLLVKYLGVIYNEIENVLPRIYRLPVYLTFYFVLFRWGLHQLIHDYQFLPSLEAASAAGCLCLWIVVKLPLQMDHWQNFLRTISKEKVNFHLFRLMGCQLYICINQSTNMIIKMFYLNNIWHRNGSCLSEGVSGCPPLLLIFGYNRHNFSLSERQIVRVL